jgi:hypothetical protein
LYNSSGYVPGRQKQAPCFAHYGCAPGLYPEDKFVVTTSIRSSTPTNIIAKPLGATRDKEKLQKCMVFVEKQFTDRTKKIDILIIMAD